MEVKTLLHEEQTRFCVQYVDELTIKHKQRVVRQPGQDTRQRVGDGEVDKQHTVSVRRPVLSDRQDVVSPSHRNQNCDVRSGSYERAHGLRRETRRRVVDVEQTGAGVMRLRDVVGVGDELVRQRRIGRHS